ncbi:MAG: TolC family protein [Gemmatimonadetes bacterium]|nr:TolC family protein [Gemmatimonadota bacterium]
MRRMIVPLLVLGLTVAVDATIAVGRLCAQGRDTLRLTLADALRIAEGSNPTYRRATNNTLLNGVEMRTTWLRELLPTATLTLNTNYTGNLQRNVLDNFGNPLANPDAEWVYFSRTSQNLNLSWRFRGPSLLQEHRRQSLVNEGRDVAQGRAFTQVQGDVQLRYMNGLEQRELMESEAELLESRRIDLDVAQRLFSLASKTRVDVLNAELAVEQQALRLQQQRAAYETALLELGAALGAGNERPIELVEGALPIFDPSGIDVDGLVARALDVNPRLVEARVAVETAGTGLAQERSAWWPEIGMGLNVYRRAQATETRALFDPALDQDLESNFFVSLSLPILSDFFGASERRQQSTVALRNERETERELRLEVERTVRTGVLALHNQWESLRLAERSREIAEEALQLAREQYRLGTRSFEELRATFDREADTRRQVIMARHAFVEALLQLEQAVGAPARTP